MSSLDSAPDEVDSFAKKHFLRNVSMLVTENAGFTIAITFVGVTTVMPTFVSRLGGSAFLVGLIGTCQTAGMLLTQILGARIAAGKPRVAPYILRPLYAGRPMMLLIGILAMFMGGRANGVLLGLFFAALFVFFATDGIASVPWYELIGKTVPATRRGRMFGTAQVASGLGGIGVGWIVSRVLDSRAIAFPANYALLFSISGAVFLVNILPFVFVKEPSYKNGEPLGESVETPVTTAGFVSALGEILRTDRNFVRVVATRLLYGVGYSVFPFYVLFMSRVAGFGPERIGLFTSAQVFGGFAGGLVVGWIADRVGTRAAVRLAAITGLVVPGLGLLMYAAPRLFGALLLVPAVVVFVLIGAATSMNTISFANYVLEAAPPKQRPNYMGLFNTIAGTMLVASPLAGWLLDRTTFAVVFAVSLAAGLSCAFTSIGLRAPNR